MSDRSDLSNLIDAAMLNPMAVQKGSIAFLEKVRNGEVEIVDASNAFVYLGEMASTMFVNAVRKMELAGRDQYPEVALTRQSLYHHMSNVDYIDTFSHPSVATIGFGFNLDELVANAVPTGQAGVKKLVIPRNTQVMVSKTIPFTLQYPIEIRVLAHGGLQVVYNNDRPSPMQTLESNRVESYVDNYNLNRDKYIVILADMYQMRSKTWTTAVIGSKIFDKTYKYDDMFYHCRVYTAEADGSWTEIDTTHSGQYFDPLKATALLQVLDDNKLRVYIPQVYYTTGLISRSMRVDIFTTQGALELTGLAGYDSSLFIPTWIDTEKDDNGIYTAPISSLRDTFIVATSAATGGSNELSFEKLKERVINNTKGPVDQPITNVQLKSWLDRLTESGFSCVTDIDITTNRVIMVSRELPAPAIEEVSTGAGSAVLTLAKTVDQLLAVADISDNGERVTMLPTTLFRDAGGYLEVVSPEERESLLNKPQDLLVEAVVADSFLYTPFHYVYDFTGNVFTVTPYYFGSPSITRRFYVSDNGTMGVGVSTGAHDLIRTDTGWSLRVSTTSTDTLKVLEDGALVAQLAFIPVGEVGRVYLNGNLVGRHPDTNEWIFEFLFHTTWDVNKANSIYLNGFAADQISPHPYAAALDTVFDIFYAVDAEQVVAGEPSLVDETMGKFLFSEFDVLGLYHEQVTLHLGDQLKGLWVMARSTIGEESYVRYAEDVPKRYTEDKPLRDDKGALVTVKDDNGIPRLQYEHRAGDIVMVNGEIDYLYRAGGIMYYEGQPIVGSPRSVLRQVELCLFDGVYYFANSVTDTEYKQSVPNQIVQWVNTTLAPTRKKVLELTDLLFHPKSTIGRIQAIADSSLTVNIAAGQILQIVYYVTEKVRKDEELKAKIRASTRAVITQLFKESVVTREHMVSVLKSTMGDDVITLSLLGLGGVNNYEVISMVDESARMCIARKLSALPNGTFGVVDNISIDFERHAVES